MRFYGLITLLSACWLIASSSLSSSSLAAHAAGAQRGAISSSGHTGEINLLKDLYRFESMDISRVTEQTEASSTSAISHLTRLPHILVKHNPEADSVSAHRAQVRLQFRAFGQDFIMNLQRSDELLPERFVVAWHDEQGQLHATHAVEHCYYHGHIEGIPESTISISTCGQGVEGWIDTPREKYLIQLSDSHRASLMNAAPHTLSNLKTQVIFRRSDMKNPPQMHCSHEYDGSKSTMSHQGEHQHDDNTRDNQDNSMILDDMTLQTVHEEMTAYEKNYQDNVDDGVSFHTDQSDIPSASVHPALKIEDQNPIVYRSKSDEYPSLSSLSSSSSSSLSSSRKSINMLPKSSETTDSSSSSSSKVHTLACDASTAVGWRPPTGCFCRRQWTYNSRTMCNGECDNPDSDPNGPWCFTNSTCNGNNYAYCQAPPATTCTTQSPSFAGMVPNVAGCSCRNQWTLNSKTYCGGICENPDNDPNGAWCFTNATCNGNNYAYCRAASTPAPTLCTASPVPSWRPNNRSCSCRSTWAFNGRTFCGGVCGSPDNDPNGPWCFTSATCSGTNYAYCSAVSVAPAPTPAPTRAPAPVTAPVSTRRLNLWLVVDNALFILRGRNLQSARDYAIRIANGARQLYLAPKFSLNINLNLVAVYVFQVTEPASLFTSASDSIDNYLDKFTTWRNNNNGRRDANWNTCTGTTAQGCVDYTSQAAHLITGSDRSGSVTGLAWLKTVCTTYATGVNEAAGQTDGFVVTTVTHELGHNFGSSHDSTGNVCPASGFIMAAIGSENDAINPTWSSCSVSAVSTYIQSNGFCLSSSARQVITNTTACGDGVIQADSGEQCDLGSDNGVSGSPCSSECQLIGQCAAGECCNIATGKFMPAGTPCRASLGSCDLPDTCSGNSGFCDNNVVPDGTSCIEHTQNGKCYQGQCSSLDVQCKSAFTGYAGNWVATAKNGLNASCMNGCGELMCTNADWPDHCFMFNCPAGVLCRVGGLVVNGPSSTPICKCLKVQNSPVTAFVNDGVACGSGDSICLNRQCVTRPAPTGSRTCNTDSDCGSNGKCTNGGQCWCESGYFGTTCNQRYQCPINCARLNRRSCITSESCGACLSGYSTTAIDIGLNTPCDLIRPTPASATSSTGDTAATLIDNNINTPWSTIWPNTSIGGDVSLTPFVVINYNEAMLIDRYDVISSDKNPAFDPSAWILEGSVDGIRWNLIDIRNNILFTQRQQKQTFIVKPQISSMFRFTVQSIYDASGSVIALNATTSTSQNVNQLNQSYPVSSSLSAETRVYVGELSLYKSTPILDEESSSSSSNNAALIGGVVGGVGGFFAVVAAAALFARHRKSQKSKSWNSVKDAGEVTNSISIPTIQSSSSANIANGSTATTTAAIAPTVLPSAFKRASMQPVIQNKAPVATLPQSLPAGWTEHQNDDGVPYYFNESTGTSSWERPAQ